MKKTLYSGIIEKITAYIRENKLRPGDRLPPYRTLAEIFGVSTSTVGNALERLHYKGVVEIRPQSGVFIMEDAWNALYPKTFNWQSYFDKSGRVPVDLLKRFSDSREKYDFSGSGCVISNLGISPEFGWHIPWKQAVIRALDNLTPESLFITSGGDLAKISGAMSEHFKYYGLDISPESVLPAQGTNHSLLSVALTFFSPGTVCYYVSPSMLDISAFFDITGLVRRAVPTDTEGIDLDYLTARIKKRENAFIAVSPELPLSGISMSMKRRRELYHLCHANGIPIVEIDEYRDYRSEQLPPIKALDKHGIVFYIGTFANMLNNSACTGWIAASPELTDRLRYVHLSMWLGCEMLPHKTMYEMLVSGVYRSYAKSVQIMMREREKELKNLFEEYLPDIACWNEKAEVFFWPKFREHIDAQKIADNNERLVLSEFSRYAFAEKNSVFISLTGIKRRDLPEAVKKLASIARRAVR